MASLQIIAGLQQFLMATRGPSLSPSLCGLAFLFLTFNTVYALYGRSQRMLRVLLWTFIAEHATIILFTVLTAHTVRWFGLCAADGVSLLFIGIGYVHASQGRPRPDVTADSRQSCMTHFCSS